jgi:hypothetical protein
LQLGVNFETNNGLKAWSTCSISSRRVALEADESRDGVCCPHIHVVDTGVVGSGRERLILFVSLNHPARPSLEETLEISASRNQNHPAQQHAAVASLYFRYNKCVEG